MKSHAKTKKIFKYSPISLQALKNLKNQIIYFGPPTGFNDPFDCTITPSITTPEDSEVEEIRKILINNNPLHEYDINKLSNEKLRESITNATQKSLQSSIENFSKNRGISCFSETNDNLLMWAHYADKYKGICLEFSTEDSAFEKLKKVEYTHKTPEINPLEVWKTDNHIEKMYCTKSADWSYEKNGDAYIKKQALNMYTNQNP